MIQSVSFYSLLLYGYADVVKPFMTRFAPLVSSYPRTGKINIRKFKFQRSKQAPASRTEAGKSSSAAAQSRLYGPRGKRYVTSHQSNHAITQQS